MVLESIDISQYRGVKGDRKNKNDKGFYQNDAASSAIMVG